MIRTIDEDVLAWLTNDHLLNVVDKAYPGMITLVDRPLICGAPFAYNGNVDLMVSCDRPTGHTGWHERDGVTWE